MAIDTRISLAGTPAPNVGQRFGQTLTNLQNIDLLNQRRDIAPLQLEQAQRANELGIAQQPANLQAAEFAASGESQLSNQQQQAQQIATSYATALRPLLSNPQALVGELQRQKAQFQQAGVDTAGIDEDILQAQTPEGLALLAQEVNSTLTPAGSRATSVSQREFNDNVAAVEADPKLETTRGKAAAIALGLEAKESLTAAERIANSAVLADAVAVAEGKKESAKETAKLQAQKKFKPQITRAVKLAEKEAIERGDTLTDLSRMEAAKPGLDDAVSQLKELAKIATTTISGKILDFAVKESGFGATKGSTARAKFIGIINNQVLPLLKPTFGGSFSVQEGESLKATMGDPDASIDEKLVQLDAFIEQKERDIRTKQSQLRQSQDDTNEFAGFKVVR